VTVTLFCQPSLLNEILADRVQWFRARADLERWIEEVEMSEEEFHRLVQGCDTMSQTWMSLAAMSAKKGYAAYARQKSDMFNQMAEDAWRSFQRAKGTWPSENVTVAEHARAHRPSVHIEW
jgi:hypothetical protein